MSRPRFGSDEPRPCTRCEAVKPAEQFHAHTRNPDGSVHTRQSYCKDCMRERQRELRGFNPRQPKLSTGEERAWRRQKYKARFTHDPAYRKMRRDSGRESAKKRRERAKADAELAERLRQEQRRYRDKMRADPGLHARLAGNYRIDHHLRTGTTLTRRAQFGAYEAPKRHQDTLPAEPLVEFLRRWFPDDWTTGEIASYSKGTLHTRGIHNLLTGAQTEVELAHVDRFFTIGLGRPDLMNAVYPVDGEAA